MPDSISTESAAQTRLRRARRGARDDGRAHLVGYTAPGGNKLAWTGDDEAPYVKVINAADDPVLVEVVGNVASGDVDAGNPVKIGARVALLTGLIGNALNDRTDLVANTRGQLQVQLAGASVWSKSNSALGTPATTFPIAIFNGVILASLCITGDVSSTDMYALVYDGTSVAGTLVDRFFIPAGGTAVRDYSTEGGISLASGCFVALTSDPGAVTAPAVGGFCHARYSSI